MFVALIANKTIVLKYMYIICNNLLCVKEQKKFKVKIKQNENYFQNIKLV